MATPVQADLKASAQRKAIDGRNHRLFAPSLAQTHKPGRRMVEHGLNGGRRGRFRCGVLFGQVLAGAEGLVACAGDDGNQETRLMVKPGEEAMGFPVRLGRERVALFGTVDGDQQDLRLGEGEEVEFGFGRGRFKVWRHDESYSSATVYQVYQVFCSRKVFAV